MANKITYTDRDRAVVNVLKQNPDGLTLAEISEAIGETLKPGHITSMKSKHLVEAIGERTFEKDGKRKVMTYAFVTDEVQMKDEKTAYKYTDGEKEVLNVVKDMDGYFTLADVAAKLGVETLNSGRVNGLIKKGNLVKGDQVEVACKVKASCNVYGFVKDIPADAE